MLNKIKVGLALGGFVALIHAVWAILVATGAAQPIVDFAFKLHMIINPMIVTEFNLLLSLALVVFTGAIGFVMGFVFATVYNWTHK